MAYFFAEPVMLLLLLIIPLALALHADYRKKKKALALKFSSVRIIKKTDKKTKLRANMPFALMLLATMLMVLGLADPHIPLKELKQGVNVVIVIDDSGSMIANDYSPTRLEAAKAASETLIKSLQEKDNVGIVIFESGATTAAYLTPYKDKAVERLRAIEQKQGKTAIGDGLSLAVDMAASIPNKKRVIVLLSDGVNNAGVISPEDAITYAKTNNIQVHTVAMGSDKQVVLGYDFFGNPQYAEPVDESTLQNIASETGGIYHRSVDQDTLNEIYKNVSENIEREWEDTSIRELLYALALAVLVINIYLIYGKYRIVV
jgi:Ca-activated chloride channel family protein